MKIEYPITEEDFLTYLLYTASSSKLVRNKRQLSLLILPIAYILLGGIAIYFGRVFYGIILCVLGGLWYSLYPIFEKKRYVKYYKKVIQEYYQTYLQNTTILEIESNTLIEKHGEIETKISLNEILEINEIQDYIFIKLKQGRSLIIPLQRIGNVSALNAKISDIATSLNIAHNVNLNWKWK